MYLNYAKSQRNTEKKCPCDLLFKIITECFWGQWAPHKCQGELCDALPAIFHPKKLVCVLEEEMPSTFHLLLIQCASLYRYLNSIHITWKFLEGKHLIDFRPFLIYNTA